MNEFEYKNWNFVDDEHQRMSRLFFDNPEEIPKIINALRKRAEKLETALTRIRDCDFVITLPDRMDAVRAIAREALE
jgi:hypothetical protein